MNGATVRRLEALEARASEARRRSEDAACDALLATMVPEHVAMIRAAAGPHLRALAAPNPAGETFAARLIRTDPPALVRAALMLVAWHLFEGRPLTLPDYVAEVYVDDPSALPGNPCDGCGYCMPMRGRLLPIGAIKGADGGGVYVGPCPVCTGYRNGQGAASA